VCRYAVHFSLNLSSDLITRVLSLLAAVCSIFNCFIKALYTVKVKKLISTVGWMCLDDWWWTYDISVYWCIVVVCGLNKRLGKSVTTGCWKLNIYIKWVRRICYAPCVAEWYSGRHRVWRLDGKGWFKLELSYCHLLGQPRSQRSRKLQSIVDAITNFYGTSKVCVCPSLNPVVGRVAKTMSREMLLHPCVN